jgi:hypothetical protein
MPVAVAHPATDRPSTRGSHGKSVLPAARCHQALLCNYFPPIEAYEHTSPSPAAPPLPTGTATRPRKEVVSSSYRYPVPSSLLHHLTSGLVRADYSLYPTYSVRHRIRFRECVASHRALHIFIPTLDYFLPYIYIYTHTYISLSTKPRPATYLLPYGGLVPRPCRWSIHACVDVRSS